MNKMTLELSSSVYEAFATFIANPSTIALPLVLKDGIVESLPAVHAPKATMSFQIALNEVKAILNPRIPMYLILRRNEALVAITFAPYLADATQRQHLLDYRHELVRHLGSEHFSQSLICKEIGEITDARSWAERDLENNQDKQPSAHDGTSGACEEANCTSCTVKDSGYKRTKCRLCDRRMQNPITPDALEALRTLSTSTPGSLVQITVGPSTLTLTLLKAARDITPEQVPSLLPPSIPSFTFYQHPTSHTLYFISFCPDSAPVKQRMTHTMAIPGLLVHAEDVGVRAGRTMEVHEVDEIDFEVGVEGEKGREGGGGGEEGEKGKVVDKGKFRSVYRREGFVGTELGYEGLERDREFADSVK